MKNAPATMEEYEEFKRAEQKKWRRTNLFFVAVFVGGAICLLGIWAYRVLS